MNIQTFIFNWRGQYEKTLEKEAQLTALGKNPIVINSDDEHQDPKWHNIGEESYFTAQFLKAIEVFDETKGDVLFHVQADASYDNWEALYADAEKYFELTDWGIYAPNVDYTWYDSTRSDIESIAFPLDKLKIVANTDCTCWFIHKDVIKWYKETKLDFSQYGMGWCWDIIFPALCFIHQRPVIRDYNHTVSHPRGTNYDTTKAEQEMWHLYNSLPDNLKKAFGYIKGDKEKLSEYYE
jgi:hypothetical protein